MFKLATFFMLHITSMKEYDLPIVNLIEQTTSQFPWEQGLFYSCFNIYESYVAKIEENTIGFGIIAIYEQIQEAHLLNFAIAQNFHRQGIGSMLLNYLINTCNNRANKIFLEVAVDNYPAITLYKKFKFDVIGIRKDYYINNHLKQDALVLVLNF